MTQIRLMKPYISFNDVQDDFRAVFESGIFTRGEHVQAFRRDLAKFTSAPHVHLTTSATTALWLCLKLLRVQPGDEVVISDFSFPATANVVEDLGATPVFADVSLHTYNLLVQALEQAITPRTKAVIVVDALGNPSGLNAIASFCRDRRIPLIEDAACAIGSAEAGKRCGAIADLTCFSFHPRKLISTGEGGAITTSRTDWSQWLDIKLSHGAHGLKGPALDFVDFGYNFRLPELQAIMGSKQLSRIDEIVHNRNLVREAYLSELEPLGFVAQSIHENVHFNVQSLTFAVPPGCSRNALIASLTARGIESTIGTYSMSSTSFYSKKYKAKCPNSAWLEANTISLPCFDDVDVAKVCDQIKNSL